jgi:hypothetical protein
MGKGKKVQMSSVDSESPVLPPLATYMKVDFLYNQDGGVWLLHDKPLPDILKWVEYDADRGVVTLNTAQGKTQELGLPLPGVAASRLRKAIEITVLLMDKGKIMDFAIVPLNTTGAAS